jgi:hypothetical protein
MSDVELNAAIIRLRTHVLKRAAAKRRLAIPGALESLMLIQSDADIWSAILAHNTGLMGTLRKIPITVDSWWSFLRNDWNQWRR